MAHQPNNSLPEAAAELFLEQGAGGIVDALKLLLNSVMTCKENTI